MKTRLPDPAALACSEIEWQLAKEMTDLYAPKTLPLSWRERHLSESDAFYGGRVYEHQDGRRVLLSMGFHEGQWWLHVSLVCPRRLPFYAELAEVKRWFIGKKRQAIQVFPPESEHVNIHNTCLHLWACVEPEGDGLPRFGSGGSI